MHSSPGCSGFVSGSADRSVKFWEWAIAVDEASSRRQLTISHTRTLEMTDDVLGVRMTPNGNRYGPASVLLSTLAEVRPAETRALLGLCCSCIVVVHLGPVWPLFFGVGRVELAMCQSVALVAAVCGDMQCMQRDALAAWHTAARGLATWRLQSVRL